MSSQRDLSFRGYVQLRTCVIIHMHICTKINSLLGPCFICQLAVLVIYSVGKNEHPFCNTALTSLFSISIHQSHRKVQLLINNPLVLAKTYKKYLWKYKIWNWPILWIFEVCEGDNSHTTIPALFNCYKKKPFVDTLKQANSVSKPPATIFGHGYKAIKQTDVLLYLYTYFLKVLSLKCLSHLLLHIL